MENFLNRMKSLLGDEYDEYLQYYNSFENFRGIRVNTLKCSSDKLGELLDFELQSTPFCAEGFYVPPFVRSLGNNPLHHAGAFYIQEPSATSAVTMLGVEQGDKVLDLCAAPGGKSTQIAAKLGGTGLLWSNEIVRNRAIILLSNIERVGVRNSVVSNCRPDVLCEKLTGYFDKVLVDAPCSGEGMFRKNSAAQEWSVEHVRSCAERQLKILNSAKLALKENGVLVYSTCTFSEEENEGVITRFLSENPDFVIEDSGVSFGRPTLEFARRVFPMDGGEGHFAVRLRKTSGTYSVPDDSPSQQKIPEYIYDFYNDIFMDRPFGEQLELCGDKIIAATVRLPDTKGLAILNKGLKLGEIRKNRVEPCHQAFMASEPHELTRSVDFDVNSYEIKKFLHGEQLPISGDIKGFTGVSVNGITVGFGKASNGVLKNKYPKGLRLL
ncbi:MAG: RsmB/NOP family class I SAM-dependent RNA methyltransferase [Ruminococcus sp.]|nr:RsmB/NOP family class I SAM-dependent RNA methyltransferase [Ruminococcus sp.]